MEANNNHQNNLVPASILIAAAIIGGALLLHSDGEGETVAASAAGGRGAALSSADIAKITLPIHWGALGQKMVSVGVLAREKFLALYAGTDREIARRLIDEAHEEPIMVTKENAGIVLNLLWGVGLGNKSNILDTGEMMDPRYGGASQFASTGGWTISDGDPMAHYSRHPFIVLTPEQEELVARVAEGIFRPCCDNSTHFSDCNHGMAMLGLLEIMAADGASENEMYDAGLALNRLWFPSQYEAITRYIAARGERADAQTLLSAAYSSGTGFQRIARELETLPAPVPRQQGGGGSSGGCRV
jgi:hypothetical protein